LRTPGINDAHQIWQIAIPTGNLVATYRGIRIVIKRNETGNPIESGFFINGTEVEGIPIDCDEDLAKKIGTDIVDQRIPVDERWREAEKKDQESDLS
jgi:hypothetical protein